MRATQVARAFVCLLSVAASAAHANDPDALRRNEHIEDKTEAPYFVVPDVDARLDPLPLREVAVHADVSGVVADVSVTQLWENTGATPIDATYVFPLSTRAAVHALEMRVGGRRIVAEIKEKEAARKTFDDAKAAGKTATLLEQSRPNLFTTKVANIAPGDVIEVELSYVELLEPTDGVYSLVVPKVVGPRYISPNEADPDIPWSAIATTDDHPRPVLYAWPVSVSIRGGVPVQWARSETHPIDVEKSDDGTGVDVEIADADPDATQDFVLDYALGGDALATGVLLQPDASGQGGHFLALVDPPERVDPKLVPHRDYVFIVDTSGSMGGWPLQVAQRLVSELVDGLDADDRVDVLCFSGGSERLAPASIPATAANKQRARDFLASQHGAGGTELLPALESAFATPRAPGLARTFVVVTDGYVSIEAQAIDLIRARAGDANVFAIGVGNGVNRHLIEGVAKAGGGEPYVALDEAGADDIAERFLDDVRAPVLTDVAFRFDGFDAYDVEPKAIPTLYATRPLLVTGRYRGAPSGKLVVSGLTGAGPWRSETAIAGGETHPAVPLLWARERIARLSDFAGADDAPDHKAEVTKLGLAYALVTQYTSFVAVDEERVGAAAPHRRESPIVEPIESGEDEDGDGFGQGRGAGMGFMGSGSGGGGMGYGVGGGTLGARGHLGVVTVVRPTIVTLGPASADGKGAPPDVLAAFRRGLGALGKCVAHPAQGVAQKLVWSVTIGPDGRVLAAHLDLGTLDASATTCTSRWLRAVRVPPAKGPARTVSLTLIVSST